MSERLTQRIQTGVGLEITSASKGMSAYLCLFKHIQRHTYVNGACTSLLSYLQVDAPGHDQRGHQQVCDSQADNQVVGGGLQSLLSGHSNAHQHVAEDDDEDEQREQHGVVVVRVLVLSIGLVEAPCSIVIETVIVGILGKDIH